MTEGKINISCNHINIIIIDKDEYDLWPIIKDTLYKCLPLKSIPIKLPPRATHLIPTLDLSFVDFEKTRKQTKPSLFLQKPLVNIYLLDCDVIIL